MYQISVIERAIELCGYTLDDVKLRNHRVVRSKGFIPGVKDKVKWDALGRCYTLKGSPLPRYDLPLSTVIEEQKMEEFKDVCRS